MKAIFFSYISLTDIQEMHLCQIELPFLYSTLTLFTGWLKQGLYDFSSLPLGLKAHMRESDICLLEQLPGKCREVATWLSLLQQLKKLSEVLLHIIPHLIKNLSDLAQVRRTYVLSMLIHAISLLSKCLVV